MLADVEGAAPQSSLPTIEESEEGSVDVRWRGHDHFSEEDGADGADSRGT